MKALVSLSRRQEEILRLAGEGLADKEIALEIGVAVGTLRTYWERMRKKTGARSRGEIIARVIREKFDGLRSEYELQSVLLRTLPFGLWTVNGSGRFEFWNNWFCDFGGLRVDEIADNGCRALMLPEDLSASAARWARARQLSEPYSAPVRLFCANDQSFRWHQIRLFPIVSPDKTVERWCGTAHEIAPTGAFSGLQQN